MTNDSKDTAAQPEEPVTVSGTLVDDEGRVEGVGSVTEQDNYAVLVAQFADMDSAKQAYYALLDAEAKRAIDIEGVLVANADYQGKVHIQKMTDHTTRKGFAWGAVGGAVVGLIFPPSILVGAVAFGVAGAFFGKAGNVMKKTEMADQLASVLAPGTSGIVALVAITAVDAVKRAIPQATLVKSVPVDNETAEAVKEAAKQAGDQQAGDQPAN